MVLDWTGQCQTGTQDWLCGGRDPTVLGSSGFQPGHCVQARVRVTCSCVVQSMRWRQVHQCTQVPEAGPLFVLFYLERCSLEGTSKVQRGTRFTQTSPAALAPSLQRWCWCSLLLLRLALSTAAKSHKCTHYTTTVIVVHLVGCGSLRQMDKLSPQSCPCPALVSRCVSKKRL